MTTPEPPVQPEHCAQNTDRELWRQSDSYYAPSIHVTADGYIGMNVGGHVIGAAVEVWHRALADRAARSPVPESKPVDRWIKDGDKWRHLFISGAFVYLDGVQSSPWPDKPEA